MKKIIFVIVSLTAIILISGSIFLTWYFRASLPQTSGVFSTENIGEQVTITYDKMGIPQVWAKSKPDMYYALGWIHANDRLFQMETTRRVSQGKLSEIFGAVTLDFDKMQRKIGHIRLAKKALNDLDTESRLALQNYVNGINDRARSLDALPFEFGILSIEFEPWLIEECLAIMSFQTWYSDALQNVESIFQKAIENENYDRLRQLILPYPDWSFPTVQQNQRNRKFAILDRKQIANQIIGMHGFLPSMSLASNSWVIAPYKSKNNSTILASDPHLELVRMPQFWYMVGLHSATDSLDAIGITTPGLPVISMGHNGQIAWAFTAGGVKITETYYEMLNPSDKNQYKQENGWANFGQIEELIYTKGQTDPETLKVKFTENGPVIDKVDSLEYALTQHWAGYDLSLSRAVQNGLKLIEQNEFFGFRSTVTNLGALNANWMYADKAGNIGYVLGSPVPVRTVSPLLELPLGWDPKFKWQGYYPLEKVPQSFNPQNGWLASCNNKPDQENLDYELEGYFEFDRILRINELLDSQDQFDVYEIQNQQMDLKSSYLLKWKHEIAQQFEKTGIEEINQKLLSWDGFMSIDSEAAAIIEVWLHTYKKLIFEDELGSVYFRIKDNVLEKLISNPQSEWFDNINTPDKIETADSVAYYTCINTLKLIKNKPWGKVQTLTMSHPLSVVPVLSSLLGLQKGPFAKPGAASTLNSSFNLLKNNGIESIVGPSWRFVIDFANPDSATFVIPAGQSGHPLSVHYFDFYSFWAKGKRWNVPLSFQNVIQTSVSEVLIQPVVEN